jgi:starvation-inducible DNA-binding protein
VYVLLIGIKMSLNNIGLKKEKSEKVAKKLNALLANYTVFYMNVRGYHWNVKGKQFFTLHEKFEELYDSLYNKIDEIAERILTLGYTPTHSYTDFVKNSKIKEQKNVSDGEKTVEQILDSLKLLIIQQREILSFVGELGDDGTDDLISAYISEQEKLVWMYSAFLNQTV